MPQCPSDRRQLESDKTHGVSDKAYDVSDKTYGVSDTEKGESVSDSIISLSDTDHSVSDSMSPLSDTGYSVSDSISIVSDTAASLSDSADSPSDTAPLRQNRLDCGPPRPNRTNVPQERFRAAFSVSHPHSLGLIIAPDETRWEEVRLGLMDFVRNCQRSDLPWAGQSGRCFFQLGMELGLANQWQKELAVLYRASQALRLANPV